MDRDKAPATLKGSKFSLDPRTTYHLPNERFIAYMQRKSEEAGATVIVDEVEGVVQDESGDVASLKLKSGQEIAGDLFVDCSGFGSLLLGETLEEPYVSYRDALFCDRAVIGSWERDDAVKPYTTISTMEHGWAWRIEFAEAVTRGYVYASQFVSDEEAAQELKEKNPELGEDPDLRVLRFPSGRRERNVVRNVAAVGNASGFVEPLEATALHLIIEQVHSLADGLIDTNHRLTPELRSLLNGRFDSQRRQALGVQRDGVDRYAVAPRHGRARDLRGQRRGRGIVGRRRAAEGEGGSCGISAPSAGPWSSLAAPPRGKSAPRLDARPPTRVHVPMPAPTTLSELIALYLARCRIEGLSPRTQRAEARTASLVAAVATRDDGANHFTVVEEDRIRMTPLPRRE